jgi:hypothetical protein
MTFCAIHSGHDLAQLGKQRVSGWVGASAKDILAKMKVAKA